MLVHFRKELILEGANNRTSRKHFWSKLETNRCKCYHFTSIRGICDDSEVEAEVERLTKEAMLTEKGYGEGFSGWERVVPFEELPALYSRLGWAREDRRFPAGVKIEDISTWPMEKVLKKLTGKQFAQFCKDTGIAWKEGN